MSDAEQSRGSEAERAALTARHQIAVERLRDALRVEVAAFVSAEVERRLRARPHFFGRMAAGPRASLRTRVDADSDRAVAALAQPIADLRIYYGAESRAAAEEDAGFTKTVTEAAHAATRRLLGELAFPYFPRRIVLPEGSLLVGALVVLTVASLGSALGARHALRVDPQRALEG